MEIWPQGRIQGDASLLFIVVTDPCTRKYAQGLGLTSTKGMRWLLLKKNSEGNGTHRVFAAEEKLFIVPLV